MMSTQYILDSNICIHFMKERAEVIEEIRKVGWSNCHIAEISVAELLFGAECSSNRDKNTELVEAFLQNVHIVPFSVGIREFCKQKARLRPYAQLYSISLRYNLPQIHKNHNFWQIINSRI